MSIEIEFYFNDLAVGYFEEDDYPIIEGEYNYMPYRGEGHYQMVNNNEIKDTICYYISNEKKTFFKVASTRNYGVLKLSNFKQESDFKRS